MTRRLAFSPNHRSLYITTNKITSLRSLYRWVAPDVPNGAIVIDISRIDSIWKGQLTKRFTLCNDKTMEATSLTIVYYASGNNSNNPNKMETMDFIVPDPTDYMHLVTSLDNLIKLYRVQKQSLGTPLRVLEFYFVEMGKKMDDYMSLNEFCTLCQVLNGPFKTKSDSVGTLYRDLLKKVRKSTQNDVQDLPFWAIVELLKDVEQLSKQVSGLSLVKQDPVSKLWNEILATDPVPDTAKGGNKAPAKVATTLEQEFQARSTISNVAFLSFLRSQQKDFKAQPDHAAEIIKKLKEQVGTSQDLLSLNDEVVDLDEKADDRLDKAKFLSYLMADDNDLFDPTMGEIHDDMTYPLSSYWISSSHDTYLSCESLNEEGLPTQSGGELYMNALSRGVRCLELDVWDSVGPEEEPVISRQEPSPCALTLEVVLKIVRQFVLANPQCYPVLLNIENHCSFKLQEIMAKQLYRILGSIGLLVVPDDSQTTDGKDLLPSPQSMMGKVLVIGKRPDVIKEGARIVNDDYDDENDDFGRFGLVNVKSRNEEEDEELEEMKNGVVIGFDTAGPIRSTDPDPTLTRHTAGELLWMEKSTLESKRIDAANAELEAIRAADQAETAENEMDELIAEVGLTKDQVIAMSTRLNDGNAEPDDPGPLADRSEDEGVEVQEFFADAVEGARDEFSRADADAIKAAEQATSALQELNAATTRLRQAEKNMDQARADERKTINKYQRAAAEARAQREDYDQMQERVLKLKEMLMQMDKSASSAENVVSTAVTEAKISEKRAAETEARAARAAATAAKDRAWADEENHKEEKLEKLATSLHDKMAKATDEIERLRLEMEKAAHSLDKTIEQIKLIENSSQYITETEEAGGEEKKINSPSSAGKTILKHARKVEERETQSSRLKKLSINLTAAENSRRKIQLEFEKRAVEWKEQTNIAAKARKQADKSSQIAEDLAEDAEEEREAANLRRVARERAESNISAKGENRESLKAQLAEAEKQAAQAKLAAKEARMEASRLTHLNDNIDNHEDLKAEVERRKEERDVALQLYENKVTFQKETTNKAAEARRRFDLSEVVYKEAMRNASEVEQSQNAQRHNDRKLIVLYNSATLARKHAEHAFEKARYVQSLVIEQELIVQRARDYKDKTERICEIPTSLARMTFLNTTKYRYWTKSFTLPNTNAHSFAQNVLDKILGQAEKDIRNLTEFTTEHLCRTFPSWKAARADRLNVDPLHQWAMGCQLVALNMTAFDEHVMKSDGRFRYNGSCGYVLKPASLRHVHSISETREKWSIAVLCGSYLPSPISKRTGSFVNPYVKVSMYGSDQKNLHYRTKAVKKNGLNPVWNDEQGFEFVCKVPSMSMLVFSVWDKDPDCPDGFIGAAAMPISCIREGYRSVPLFDRYHTRNGAHAFSSLLVHAQRNAT
eukprot:scaffold6870_cov121-Cylindrotheca_fusiformis.AAC.8